MEMVNPVALIGDVGDFASLLRQHQSMVFSLALHFLRDRQAAEDVAQEVFLELHRSLGKIKSAEHATFWLRKVTATKSIDASRKAKRRTEVPLDDVEEPAAVNTVYSGSSEDLRRLVASLPEKQRMVVIMRYQEEMEPEEIADALEVPVNTVKSQLQRALALLREKTTRGER